MKTNYDQFQIKEILKNLELTEKDVIISNPINDFSKERNENKDDKKSINPRSAVGNCLNL